MSAAPPPELDGRQRRHLRALGHHQKPVVQVGKALTPGVIEAVNEALTQHELVKVRVSADVATPLAEVGEELAEKTRSALAQTIGRTLLFYRPHPKKPRIVLPRAGAKP
jgi:RNA-binding protein